MNPPDNDVLAFIKDWLWAPLLGLIAWAWNRNEKEHEMLRNSHEQLREHTSSGYSTLNDRVMEHVDTRVGELRQFVQVEDARLLSEQSVQRGHIGKLFDKLEEHGRRSEDRHNEVLGALREMTQSFHTSLNQKADK